LGEWHETHGRHILLDIWDAEPELLNDLAAVQETMLEAADAAGAAVVGNMFHRFPVQGLSGVVLLAESHISVHTFPEHGYAAFDIFTCGEHVDPDAACDHIVRRFGGERYVKRFDRGLAGGIAERPVAPLSSASAS